MEMETQGMAACYEIDRGFVDDRGSEERAGAGFQLHLDNFMLSTLTETEGKPR